jgi:hypothetical protein
MKTIVLLFILLLFSASSFKQVIKIGLSEDVLIGVYEGMTENLEFEFSDSEGKEYLFDQIAENLDYDLFDEQFVGQKFKINWQKRTVAILNHMGKPTGETKEIKVIVGLEKL